MSADASPGPARALLLFLAGCLLAAAAGAARAQGPPRLGSVSFSGNATVPSGDLLSSLRLERGDPLTDSAIAAALAAVTSLYHGQALYGATATASLVGVVPDPGGGAGVADLAITVREGNRAILGALSFTGVRAIEPAAAAELFPVAPGDPLEPGALSTGVAALLRWYDRSGYPFASASIAAIDAAAGGAEGAMTVAVEVDEGEAVELVEVRAEGNAETSPEVITREFRSALPARYDPAAVDRFTGRLRRLGIFSSVAEPTLYTPGGLEGSGGVASEPAGDSGARSPRAVGLLVKVTEGRTSTFDGILGYAPEPAGGGGGSFNGSVVLGFRNLFGTARRLDASWMKPGGRTQEIRVAYEEPWAFGFPVNLGGAFSQRRQDTTYVDTRWRVALEFLATASLSVSGVAEGQGVVPSEGSAGAPVPATRSTTGGAVVRYDTRDDRELPRSGVDFRTELRSGRKTLREGDGGSSAIRHLGFDFDVFLPTAREQVLAFSAHGRELTTDAPGPADLYRLGGFRTLRGFREEQFSGVRTAWGTAEYRLLAGGKSFFYGFLDPGYVLGAEGADDLFTFGYGIGMRLETAIGLVGVSFALGEGDPVSQTKIHFGLINDF